MILGTRQLLGVNSPTIGTTTECLDYSGFQEVTDFVEYFKNMFKFLCKASYFSLRIWQTSLEKKH